MLQVKHVFLVTGAGIMTLTDGIAKNPDIEPIPVHHEQAAAMAADAYAKVSGKTSVSLYSTGPAATNALTGLAGAWQDSIPSLFISGQVKTSESTYYLSSRPGVRQLGVQELDIIPAAASFSKYAKQVTDPLQIRYELEKSTYIASSGRPGPVWLEIPMDVQGALIEKSDLIGFSTPSHVEESRAQSEKGESELLADLMIAQRPVILAGQGIRLSSAQVVLNSFSRKFSIPVVSTYLGIDGASQENPNYIGKVGVKGDRAGNLALQNSDLLIAVGTSLHVSATGYSYGEFARAAKVYVVDIDEESHSKVTVDVDKYIFRDARDFLVHLELAAKAADYNPDNSWLSQCTNWARKYPVCPEPKIDGSLGIYSFVGSLNGAAEAKDIFVSDAGSAYYAVSQGISMKYSSQRYVTSGAMATMGFTVPAAIGASLAAGRGRVLAVTGDGSFQQNIQELQTIKQQNLPIKLFVLNNDGYLSIRASQSNYFNSRFIGSGPESQLTMPDTLAIGEAYGIPAARAKDSKSLVGLLEQALRVDGPFILEVVLPRNEAIEPSVSSRLREDGTMESRPLEDMAPFLTREEYLSNLYVDPV